ncbi:WbqC family protein [Desertimonas flava]|uniref:WbqC family protein n=1 Tax=Desertimonas flava TaxID=2064846 RepID=UPI000E35028E|nr:WbqC family protein [Desertimonas flava]
MRLAAHQPLFWPPMYLMQRWLHVDTLVWLGSVQFTRKSRDEHGRNRPTGQNRIVLGDAAGNDVDVTVPVGASRQPIDDTPLGDWADSFISTVCHLYPETPERDVVCHAAAELEGEPLGSVNRATWSLTIGLLDVKAPHVVDDTSLPPVDDRVDRLVTYCRQLGATTYVAGKPAINAYLDANAFAAAGVTLTPQDWTPPHGVQAGRSVLDSILRRGVDRTRKALGW